MRSRVFFLLVSFAILPAGGSDASIMGNPAKGKPHRPVVIVDKTHFDIGNTALARDVCH